MFHDKYERPQYRNLPNENDGTRLYWHLVKWGQEGRDYLSFLGHLPPPKKTMGGTFDFWAAQFLQKNSDLWPALGRKTSGATCSTIFSSLSFKHCNDFEFQAVSEQLPSKAKNADICLIWYVPITKVLAHDSCDWLFTRPRNIWRRGKWKMRKIFGEGMYLVCQTPSKAQLSLVQLSTAVYSCWISLIIFST